MQRLRKPKKKPKSTVERFLEDPEQKRIFEEEHKEFLLSELIIALMEEDHISVRKLAKVAGVFLLLLSKHSVRAKRIISLSLQSPPLHMLLGTLLL